MLTLARAPPLVRKEKKRKADVDTTDNKKYIATASGGGFLMDLLQGRGRVSFLETVSAYSCCTFRLMALSVNSVEIEIEQDLRSTFNERASETSART